MTPTSFEAMPLASPIQRALSLRDYVTPSPIQAEAIPLLLEGRDLLGCAQTGTGKTAAFSLPILQSLHDDRKPLRAKSPRVLVLTPTRELATQVGKSLEDYGEFLDFKHALVFGGVRQGPQVRAMQRGVDVLVACPGRLLDLVDQRYIDLRSVEFFVLDEVDRMLDMGFQKDVTRIVSMLPTDRQSLFFSATLAPDIVKLSKTILRDPAMVTIAPEKTTAEAVEQRVCFVAREDKRRLLLEVLKSQAEGELTIVFARTKFGADKLARFLSQSGVKSEAIHGNRSQSQRDKTLNRFRKGRLPVLVATDVAARGVDVREVTLVVNFDLPNEAEAYVHRIGRTGRAGADGCAISFCAHDEREFLRAIEKLIKKRIDVNADHEWHVEALAKQHAQGNRGGNGGKPSKFGKRNSSRKSYGRDERSERASRPPRRRRRPRAQGRRNEGALAR
ncbi:MAG: DEAD/DEAH box helicase [Verrucomicrobiota bacterium]